MADVTISRLHAPVTTLGPGRRAGVWFQGCSIGCAGCISRDTWNADRSRAVDVEDVVRWCIDAVEKRQLDGVTVSGGEPFDQPVALQSMLSALREHFGDRHDVLVFSGYSLERLQSNHAGVLELIDVLVSDPFIERRQGSQRLRGSSNQRITFLDERRASAYATWLDEIGERPRVQVSVDGDSIWMIGIPAPGDIDRFEEALAARGVELGVVSWRS